LKLLAHITYAHFTPFCQLIINRSKSIEVYP
jgi:hypothetical protein